MKIFSLNVNRFGKTKNFKYNNSTPIEKADWYSDLNCDLRKATARNIANYVIDSKKKIDIALFQEVDYRQESFNEFVSYFVKMGYQVKIPQGIGFTSRVAFTNMIVVKDNIQIVYEPNQYCDVLARWQECKINFKNREISILNLHADFRFYDPLQKYIPMRKDDYFIVMGDYNAASNEDRAVKKEEDDEILISNTKIINIFNDNAFVDIKDKKNIYTYYPHGRSGRRLDHCFISKSLKDSFECIGETDGNVNALLHSDTGLTDHSAIILEIK